MGPQLKMVKQLLIAVVVLSILQGHSAAPQVKREAKPQEVGDLSGLLSGVINTGVRVFSMLVTNAGGDPQKVASDIAVRALTVISTVSRSLNNESTRSARAGSGGGSSLSSILGFGNNGGSVSPPAQPPKADLSQVPEPSFDDIPENVF